MANHCAMHSNDSLRLHTHHFCLVGVLFLSELVREDELDGLANSVRIRGEAERLRVIGLERNLLFLGVLSR